MAISRKLLDEGETVIVPVMVLVALLVVGTWVQVTVDQDVVTLVGWVLAAIGIVWYVLRPLMRWATAAYTDRRLITRSGGLARRGHEMPLARRVNRLLQDIHDPAAGHEGA